MSAQQQPLANEVNTSEASEAGQGMLNARQFSMSVRLQPQRGTRPAPVVWPALLQRLACANAASNHQQPRRRCLPLRLRPAWHRATVSRCKWKQPSAVQFRVVLVTCCMIGWTRASACRQVWVGSRRVAAASPEFWTKHGHWPDCCTCLSSLLQLTGAASLALDGWKADGRGES